MTDQQPTDRAVTNEVIAPAVLEAVEKYEKATKVARGLRDTRNLRQAARGEGR
ncbi:hypothetical protein [Actinophytocola sediminis]